MEEQGNRLHHKAAALAWFTVLYNVAEGLVMIIFGNAAGSIAMVGFGLDSFVESLSGGVMLWRFRKRGEESAEQREAEEKKASKAVGITFIVLAAYVVFESAKKLILQEPPEPSMVGIVVAVISIAIMYPLYMLKCATGKGLKSCSLMADAKQTLACMWLSFALLAGLLVNQFLGWWWADPAVGLFIAYFLVKEGIEAAKGEFDED